MKIFHLNNQPVFSVNLVCKKELNLMLKVSKTSSQGAMGFELRGNDLFLPILYDLNKCCNDFAMFNVFALGLI